MIVKVPNFIENYRAKAKYAKDIHQLAGRGTWRPLTEFINTRLCQELRIGQDDQVVDIGCGDGTLLRMAAALGVKQATGLCATEEEASRLSATGLNAAQGYTDNLPLADSCASVVVSNSVLVIVPRNKIPASLREMARIAMPGARIWVGEIPYKLEGGGDPRHTSVLSMLWWLLRKRGLRTFLGKCRQLLVAAIQREPIILNAAPPVEFYAAPEEFIQLAKDAGLTLVRQLPTQFLDHQGSVITSDSRRDYLFARTTFQTPDSISSHHAHS